MTAGATDQWHGVVTDRLLDLYRRYLGEPDQLSDVYVGFTLFFGGVTMAAVGVVVFLWSSTLPARPGIYWQLREIAISLAMLGLPAFMLGVVVLLPTDRRALIGSGVGAAVCLGAVGLFVANYPRNWNAPGADASATGVSVYAVGVVLATGAVGAALVSNYIAQSGRTPQTAQAPDASSKADSAAEESVSESQVRADIDDAMSEADLSWGGVEKDDTKRLKIRTDEGDIDRSGFDATGANESRAAGSDVDAAVDGLQQLRGGKTDEATGEGTDDQADALRQLRERQAAEDEADSDGVVSKLRDRIGL
jgi:hypothetical protein